MYGNHLDIHSFPTRRSSDLLRFFFDRLVAVARHGERRFVKFVDLFRQPTQPLVFRSRRKRLRGLDRKSTRLNSSHVESSYAVFCLKTKSGTWVRFVGLLASC